MGTLSDYIEDTAAILHDQRFLFTSRRQLVKWVNESRRQCAARSGCIARLVTGQSAFGASAQAGAFVPGGAQPGSLPGALPDAAFNNNASVNSLQTIPGQERYPFRGFFNPYLQQAYAGVEGIVDVISLSVNWGGAVRPTLAWMPWEDLQAYARAYATLIESYPYYWSVMNDGTEGEVWLFPPASTTGDIEAYCFCTPKPIYSDDDFDAIPDGYRNAIKFHAASLAFASKRQTAEAEYYDQEFNSRIGVANVQKDRGKTPNMYWQAF